MEFKCTCHNSGTNSFTGKCSNCGMAKPSQGSLITNTSTPMEHYKTLHENKVMINPPSKEKLEYIKEKYHISELIIKMKEAVLDLQQYHSDYYEVVESSDGEYVKLEDVLNLISAKKVKRTVKI